MGNFARKSFVVFYGILLIGILILSSNNSFSQDCFDTINLSETEIKANKIRYSDLLGPQQPLELHEMGLSGKNIGEVLSLNTNLSVRVTAPGNLSTISYRGTNSSQTSLFWNGLNINSSSTGQADLSQIPSFFADFLDYTGKEKNQTLTTAGNITLTSCKSDHKGLKSIIMQEAGSSGLFSTSGSISYGNELFSSRIKIISTSSANDYKYQNRSKSFVSPPTETRQNASFVRHGIMAEGELLLTPAQSLEAKFLYTAGSNNIPQPVHLPIQTGNENQEEQHLKSSVTWFFSTPSFRFSILSAYTFDDLVYTDHTLGIHSEIVGKAFTNRFSFDKGISKKLHYSGVLENILSSVSTMNYDGKKNRITSEISNSILFETERLNIKSFLKISKTDSQSLQGLPGIAISGKPVKKIPLEISYDLHNTYRLPSMNDLYWNPGGNPELKAEKGNSSEIGLSYILLRKEHTEMKIWGTRYFISADRQIVWQPDTVGSLWRPVNLDKFWSEGWELSIEWQWVTTTNHQWFLKTALSTTDAEVIRNLNGSGAIEVIPAYVPELEYFHLLKYSYKGITGTFNSRYTGKRYTDLSNTQYLKPFWKHDLCMSYKTSFHNFELMVHINIENITNSQYEYYVWYPMPGTQFRAGLTLSFLKNKSK